MKVSLVMSSFNRAKQLSFSLASIVKQKISWDFEIVVVNDGTEDETRDVCSQYDDRLSIKYVFAGQRNANGLIIRNPSKPNNIAVKQCEGDIVILSCPEIYHLDNSLQNIITPLIAQHNIMTVPNRMLWDVDAATLNSLPSETPDLSHCQPFGLVRTKYPYLLGMWKSHFMSIGGYDEDFTGFGSEDDDLIMRLRRNGLSPYTVSALCVHLWHTSLSKWAAKTTGCSEWDIGRAYNRKLLASKRGIIRNTNRRWGEL